MRSIWSPSRCTLFLLFLLLMVLRQQLGTVGLCGCASWISMAAPRIRITFLHFGGHSPKSVLAIFFLFCSLAFFRELLLIRFEFARRGVLSFVILQRHHPNLLLLLCTFSIQSTHSHTRTLTQLHRQTHNQTQHMDRGKASHYVQTCTAWTSVPVYVCLCVCVCFGCNSFYILCVSLQRLLLLLSLLWLLLLL